MWKGGGGRLNTAQVIYTVSARLALAQKGDPKIGVHAHENLDRWAGW